jgi:tetratricopeptide (TPR) repeat protein
MPDIKLVRTQLRPTDPRYRLRSKGAHAVRGLLSVFALVFMSSSIIFAMSGGLSYVSLPALFAGAIAWSITKRRKTLQLVARSDDAVALLNQGHVDEAGRRFDELATECKSLPINHSLVVYNRGVVHLMTGNVSEAVRHFEETIGTGWLKAYRGLYDGLLWHGLASAYLASGDLARAMSTAERAHAALSEAKRPTMLLVDTAILARQHRYGEALALVQTNRDAAESLLMPHHRRALDVMEAFLWSRADAGREGAERSAALLRSGWPRGYELRAMASAWPDMTEFLQRNGVPI